MKRDLAFYALFSALFVFVFVYVNEAKNDSVACISKVQTVYAESTTELRKQSKLRFDALYDVLDQRLDPSNLKPIDSAEVQKAWSDFKTAHHAYNAALVDNPVADPETIC